jgi:hypothetical protein
MDMINSQIVYTFFDGLHFYEVFFCCNKSLSSVDKDNVVYQVVVDGERYLPDMDDGFLWNYGISVDDARACLAVSLSFHGFD